MGVWDTYLNRVEVHGGTRREAELIKKQRTLLLKTKDSLSYHSVMIDGEPRDVTIINSDNLNEKKIISLPGEDLKCGGLVYWANNYWLITEKDANTEVYTKGKLTQCNHLLRWIDDQGVIREQWCVIEDGTKYMTGDYEDRDFIVTRGDSRIAMTIGKNEHTVKFGRENRFLIDDPDSTNKLCYALSKPLKVGKHYAGEGVYMFVLREVSSTNDDNMELGITNYYKFFPRSGSESSDAIEDTSNDTAPEAAETSDTTSGGKKVWL